VTALPWGDPLTYDDLQRMPDDGHRYELVDGVLLVTPAPGSAHQVCVVALVTLLHNHCPPGLVVLTAPYDYVVNTTTVLQPDLLVAHRDDLSEANLTRTPLLVVEVRSPSTWRTDLGTKRLAYEGAGVPHYWVVDPDEPGAVVFALQEGSYQETARAAGDEELEITEPFPLTLVPQRLVERFRRPNTTDLGPPLPTP